MFNIKRSSDGVSRVTVAAKRNLTGIGYIILPVGLTRDAYIENCLRTNTVSLLTDTGECVPKCFLTRTVMNSLEFPADSVNKGSAVVWLNLPHQNTVVIVDVLSRRDQLNPLSTENSFAFTRNTDLKNISLTGNGVNASLHLTAQGAADDEGEIHLNALNSEGAALFDVYAQGDANITADNALNFKAARKVSIVIKDEETGENQAEISYTLGKGLTFVDEWGNKVSTTAGGVDATVGLGAQIKAHSAVDEAVPVLLAPVGVKMFNDMLSLLTSMCNTFETATKFQSNTKAPPIFAALVSWRAEISAMTRQLKSIVSQTFKAS